MESILTYFNKILPYEIVKKINKTGEGRGGNGIYKRRNRRSYRVLIQYKTWKKLIENEEGKNILNQYKEGYVVLITPEEYFGNNYPNKSDDLNENFELSKTGFIFYTLITEMRKYPPLEEWREVIEITNTGSNEERTWFGDYALNVKNGGKISYICGKNHKKTDIDYEKGQKLIKKLGFLNKFPDQCGLGNYDYDYANKKTIDNVKLQMLYLLLKTTTNNKTSFCEYIFENFENFNENNKESQSFKNKLRSMTFNDYEYQFNHYLNLLEKACENKGLLDFEKLKNMGIWNLNNSQLICPLCQKPIYAENFFEDINQMEGREVPDNTQKSIVLMHIKALRPAEFNHNVYNLGWGHNYCNLIQGDKDIAETINNLEEIIESYYKLKEK